MFLLHGFVAKQACLVLWLSKPAFFFFEWSLTYRGLPYFFLYLQSPSEINYLIVNPSGINYLGTYFVLLSVPINMSWLFPTSQIYLVNLLGIIRERKVKAGGGKQRVASPNLGRVIVNIAGICPQVSQAVCFAGPLYHVSLGLMVWATLHKSSVMRGSFFHLSLSLPSSVTPCLHLS